MSLQELGRRLRARRVELGLTIAQVAERAELSLPYVANLERARGNPTLDVLERLSAALETSLSVLWDDAAPITAELPGSLSRFARTADFTRAVAELAERAGAEPAAMRERVLTSMLSAPRRAGGDPTEADWRRLLDAYRLMLME